MGYVSETERKREGKVFSGTISICPLSHLPNLSMRPWNPIEILLPLKQGIMWNIYSMYAHTKHRCTNTEKHTQSQLNDTNFPLNIPFLLNGNLGRRPAPARHLTATSLRKMFLICLCHLIIHILPRLCRTILQDINSQLNPGLYHLWGQSSRSPRRSRDFLLTVVVI